MRARLMVITGGMFCGKSELLCWHLNRARLRKKKMLVLKPANDTRTGDFIASRAISDDGKTVSVVNEFPATPVHSSEELAILLRQDRYDVIAVDEGHFFPLDDPAEHPRDTLGYLGREIRLLLRERAADDLAIIVVGLDMDSMEEPFGVMPGIMAIANEVQKLTSICMTCQEEGHLTQCNVDKETQLSVGDAGMYGTACRRDHVPR